MPRGIFHRLPGGEYGLTDWYPNAKARRGAERAEPNGDGDAEEIFGSAE